MKHLPSQLIAALALAFTTATGAQTISPVFTGTWSNGPAYDVAVSSNYAYLVGGTNGLQVIDVSNPANPLRVGGAALGGNALHVAVSGNFAYVAMRTSETNGRLQVLDMSNPTNPVPMGSIEINHYATDLEVSGNLAYMTDAVGLKLINVSDAANPVNIGGVNTSNGTPWHVAVSGNFAYVAQHTRLFPIVLVIDVSNPANPVQSGMVGFPSTGSPEGLAVAGNYVYLADGQDGLQVINVSNPTDPVPVGRFFWKIYYHVVVSGNYAYVITQEIGSNYPDLGVLDLSNPANPVEIGEVRTGFGGGWSTAVSGNRIYIAGGDRGLRVIASIPNAQFTTRVDAATNAPFTIYSASSLTSPIQWTPLLTTNVSTLPFYFTDFNVRISSQSNKFYRFIIQQ